MKIFSSTRIMLGNLSTLIVLSLVGCATGGINVNHPSFSQQFSSGQVRLTCSLACAGTDGARRQQYKALFQSNQGAELARQVSDVGFDSDRNYFYLGAAAEMQGNRKAAKTYYNLGLATTSKCGGNPNVCDGFVFPRDITQRIAYINNQDSKDAAAAQAAKAKQEAEARAARETAARDAAAAQRAAQAATSAAPAAPATSAAPAAPAADQPPPTKSAPKARSVLDL